MKYEGERDRAFHVDKRIGRAENLFEQLVIARTEFAPEQFGIVKAGGSLQIVVTFLARQVRRDEGCRLNKDQKSFGSMIIADRSHKGGECDVETADLGIEVGQLTNFPRESFPFGNDLLGVRLAAHKVEVSVAHFYIHDISQFGMFVPSYYGGEPLFSERTAMRQVWRDTLKMNNAFVIEGVETFSFVHWVVSEAPLAAVMRISAHSRRLSRATASTHEVGPKAWAKVRNDWVLRLVIQRFCQTPPSRVATLQRQQRSFALVQLHHQVFARGH